MATTVVGSIAKKTSSRVATAMTGPFSSIIRDYPMYTLLHLKKVQLTMGENIEFIFHLAYVVYSRVLI